MAVCRNRERMGNRMRKRLVLLAAAAVSMTLSGCGGAKKGDAQTKAETGAAQAAEAGSAVKEEKKESEPSVESQEYISADGSYSITMLKGFEQTDVPLQANGSMMGLDSAAGRPGFSAVSMGSVKSSVPGNPERMESLEDYADHVAHLALDGPGMQVDWQEAEAENAPRMTRTIAREGLARMNGAKGRAYAVYMETEDSYFAVILIGRDADIGEAKQVLSVTLLDSASSQEKGSKAFLSAMTAVLDATNGASVVETYRALGGGAGAGPITEKAKALLSESWEINSAEELYETADWLMSEGHNRDAVEFLKQYGGTDAASREEFAVKAQEAGAGKRESLMAAYDAWSAYGESAVAAWDLSRVGTIMGFGYAAGYCTYEEAMDKMLEAAVKAQELYDSWDSFNQSYLYGYAYWAEESLEDPDSRAAQRAGLVETLAGQANGPFSVDWGTELVKEW